MKSKVYFIRVRSQSIPEKVSALGKLLDAFNPFLHFKEGELVPVKITIGDSGCRLNLQPELVRVVISGLKSRKTRPFIFDTCVIYKGSRQNAVDHLNLAHAKGFGHENIGSPFVPADGLLGLDGREYLIRAPHLEKIKVPSFVGMLDSVVVLSHVTGHILTGYGGAIKNVAMGMSSRAGKQVQHSSLKPHIIGNKCTSCGCCIEVCPADAISTRNEKSFINKEKCLGCGECICACKFDAIYINWKEDPVIFGQRLVECAEAILSKFTNRVFLNFAIDITKDCDCVVSGEGKLMTQDTGIFASTDILSVEKATTDLLNKEEDIFVRAGNPGVYHDILEYAAKRGVGNLGYDLIEVKS